MEKYLKQLNEKLRMHEEDGELHIYGGAVICLCFNRRQMTDDIDGIFAPKNSIYRYIKEISVENELPSDWLNDSVKRFVSSNNEMENYQRFSNLTVLNATPRYCLAMKLLSARNDIDEHDREDIKFLMNYIGINSVEEAESIALNYYPKSMFTFIALS